MIHADFLLPPRHISLDARYSPYALSYALKRSQNMRRIADFEQKIKAVFFV
jgi:hypothetical protein